MGFDIANILITRLYQTCSNMYLKQLMGAGITIIIERAFMAGK